MGLRCDDLFYALSIVALLQRRSFFLTFNNQGQRVLTISSGQAERIPRRFIESAFLSIRWVAYRGWTIFISPKDECLADVG